MPFRRTAALIIAASALAGCGDAADPGRSAEIIVLSVDPVLYADGSPALVFLVENRSGVTVESVAIEVDARRDGRTVAHAVTQLSDVSPGEQVESDPAVFATLDSHADYECYRYRVRGYDGRARVLWDQSSDEACS
ncbi:MAG TPA: hypothetical protein VGC13_04290 [Longimicrobium sp.]|jgi:uncharacterized protein (TIGR02588 family)|uniref:hypothetical protein n=1 Tax=Longimicrobium sp. TaxID=2029185 RepID=UPI002EDA953C